MVRIRKNATLSPLLFCSQAPADDDLKPRLCKLSQSPWDVIAPSLFDSNTYWFEAEDDLYVNGSWGHSIGAEESVAWPMDTDDKADMAAVYGGVYTNDNGFRRCGRNNGKSWQCNKEAKEGECYCEYHLYKFNLFKGRRNVKYHHIHTTSNGNANSFPSEKVFLPAKVPAEKHIARPKAVRKNGTAAPKNPYEFYYYSGFGPKWGRKRGIRRHKLEAKVAAAENVVATPTTPCTTTHNSNPESSPAHKIDNGDHLDYIEDDFDDDEDEDGGRECGRKRIRRHVKARSLKSLM